MYLTAQRVVNADGGESGVNAFLHLHGESDPSVTPNWTDTDVNEVAYQNPGIVHRQLLEMAPGGNRVVSYLDVVASDETAADRIRAALEFFGNDFVASVGSNMRVIDEIAIRLSSIQGLAGQEHLEITQLAKSMIALLAAE